MYVVGKLATKNLEKLVKSFNLTASRVNKRYANVENYTPVPTYSVKEILSRVHSYSDLRRERAKLNRFFKKNKKDAQELVFDKQTGKVVTRWFYRESRYLKKRERKQRKKIDDELKRQGKNVDDIREELEDYPRESELPDSEKSFKGLEDRLADMMLPRIAQMYIDEMIKNGYHLYPEGKETINIINLIYKNFPVYLETCFYTGDERSTIEFLYMSRDDYTTRNVLSKVNSVYHYWLECAENIAL